MLLYTLHIQSVNGQSGYIVNTWAESLNPNSSGKKKKAQTKPNTQPPSNKLEVAFKNLLHEM